MRFFAQEAVTSSKIEQFAPGMVDLGNNRRPSCRFVAIRRAAVGFTWVCPIDHALLPLSPETHSQQFPRDPFLADPQELLPHLQENIRSDPFRMGCLNPQISEGDNLPRESPVEPRRVKDGRNKSPLTGRGNVRGWTNAVNMRP